MELFFQLLLLATGLVLLWKIGELAVHNAIGFSNIYGIHQFTIGFLIFAISTGLPEISSAIISSVKKVPELSAGDLMGSTFVNVSMILGIIILVAKELEVEAQLRKNLFYTSGIIILIFIGVALIGTAGYLIAILLGLLYFAAFFLFRAGLPKKELTVEIQEIEHEIEEVEKKAWLVPKLDILLKLFGSLFLLLLSSWLTVFAAANIAKALKINLSILGGTLIAIGTGFPEISLGIHAVRKKEHALAIGDLFGAGLLNISFTLSLLIFMNKTVDLRYSRLILPFLIVCLGWIFQVLVRKKPLKRLDGSVLIAIFCLYFGWNVFKYLSHY